MRRFLLALFSFLAGSLSFAENSFFDNYVYQVWTSFGGLTGTTATSIYQTKDGYINIGTYEGLVRFDGVEFNLLRRSKDNNFKFASVRTLHEDKNGCLWLGANDEGVTCTKDGQTVTWTMQNGLPSNSIRALAEDKDGNIWVGTAAGVIYLTPDEKLLNPQFEPGSVSKGIITTHLYCDTGGRIWLTTANERGLFIFQDGIFKTLHDFNEFGNYTATAITQDRAGTFWIALGQQGLVKMNNTGIQSVKTGTILDTTTTNCIYQDPLGTIWFGTEKGLVVFSNGEYTEYTGESLRNTTINGIISDREGNIWIATDRNGIGKLTQSKFKMLKLGTAVNSICEGLDGKVWAGTDRGVLCWEKDIPVSNELTDATKGLRIRDVSLAGNGDILVSAYSAPGQIRWNGSELKSWSRDDGLVGNKVRVAIENTPGELYVGTTTGLTIIHEDGTLKSYDQNNGLENEYIMALYKDKNDVIWIGTDGGGIYFMKDERIIAHISSEDGLSGNVIFKITQDAEENYWICTGGGITRITAFDSATSRPLRYDNLNSDNGIGTDSVFQALKDSAENLWLISNRGISSVSYQRLIQAANGIVDTLDLKNYNSNDGLVSKGPTSTAKSMIDRHDRLWFTMTDGIAIYDPIKVTENPVMPLVHIESFVIDNIEYKTTSAPIVLKPGTKRVEIKYTGLSFDAPERLRFTHRLTNFEDEFSEPTQLRTISYTNLKPGRHIFYVNAINGDGFYSEQAEAVVLVQKPYFFQMPVFWIIVTAIVLGTIFLLFYLKQRSMKLENIRLEQKVQQRTAELKEEKEKSDHLLRAILPDKIAEELKGEIRSIGENFDDVTLLFSDIVNFTKTSSGHTAAEIVEALNDLFCRFDERAKAMGVEKIKTIGDAYMAACGIPSANPEHARIMIEFAKGMYEDLAEYNKTASIQFNIRIGLNCGPVTAGVIGKTKFIYDVWGNTVNVASRMETACEPGKIRVSETVRDHLKETGIKFSQPIECDVKGKGLMTTYDIV
ncbi:MAG: hypothetical protein J5780_06090 [Treponema sp.]|nr:hypothetical protein [Treponema sp.]